VCAYKRRVERLSAEIENMTEKNPPVIYKRFTNTPKSKHQVDKNRKLASLFEKQSRANPLKNIQEQTGAVDLF